MYHFYDVVINDKTGVPLSNVIIRIYDDAGVIVPLFADESGSTPIEAVSGIPNAAVTDGEGNYDFYIADGRYDIRFFVGDAVLKVLQNIQMVVAASDLDVQGKAQAAAVGVSGTASNLGTFSGTIIPDSQTAKQALQALSDAVEDRQTAPQVNSAIAAAFRARSANLIEMSGYDPTGVADMSAQYQQLIDNAAAEGVPVVAQAGIIRLASTINLPDGHVFRGYSHGAEGGNPDHASIFHFDHSGDGFVSSGNGAPVSIFDQTTKRTQPPPGPGWTPIPYGWDYRFPYINDLKMQRITHIGSWQGIFANGGRIDIIDVFAQSLKKAFRCDFSYDTCRFVGHHLWPVSLQFAEAQAFAEQNLEVYDLKSCDNWFMDDIFSIWHKDCFIIGYFPGDSGYGNRAGTVSKLKIGKADIDKGKRAYFVTPEANGHTALFGQFTAQGLDIANGSPLLHIAGPNTKIYGVFGGSRCGNLVRLEPTSTGSLIQIVPRANDWNITSEGFPCIEADPAGGWVEVLPGWDIVGGNGAAIASGNVIFPPATKPFFGTADASGNADIAHNIPLANLKVLAVSAGYQGGSTEWQQCTADYVDGGVIKITGADPLSKLRVFMTYNVMAMPW